MDANKIVHPAAQTGSYFQDAQSWEYNSCWIDDSPPRSARYRAGGDGAARHPYHRETMDACMAQALPALPGRARHWPAWDHFQVLPPSPGEGFALVAGGITGEHQPTRMAAPL